ncbi:sensor histidine kinase [Dactylosporangium cerinum]
MWAARAIIVTVFAALSVEAARADLSAGATAVLAAVDVAVGLAFAVAALAAVGSHAERLTVAAVGAAWLAGSTFAVTRSLHQSVLVVALLAFPAGRIRGVERVLLTVPAIAAALQIVPQPGVAALFAAVAPVALLSAPRTRPAVRGAAVAFPAAAGAVVAGALMYSWWGARHDPPMSPLVVYESALIAVAAGFVAATRAVRRGAGRLADQAIGGDRGSGMTGLRAVLADLLGDLDLRVDLWDTTAKQYVDPATGATRPFDAEGASPVRVDGALAARIVTTATAMADPPTAAAVRTAVGLAVANHRLRAAHEQRVAELHASRQRLLAVTDRERDRAAGALRTQVIAALDRAAEALAARDRIHVPGPDAGDLGTLLDEVVAGIGVAAADVRRIVGGAPPSALGDGRLRAAVESLAAASPVPVSVGIEPMPSAGAAVETALFYVCSEALTNIVKHAGAGRAWIRLRYTDGRFVLEVGDNGCGGADPHGSGLQGLADRLAAHGGRLTVASHANHGTLLTATIGNPAVR